MAFDQNAKSEDNLVNIATEFHEQASKIKQAIEAMPDLKPDLKGKVRSRVLALRADLQLLMDQIQTEWA